MKKTEHEKSHDTVPLKQQWFDYLLVLCFLIVLFRLSPWYEGYLKYSNDKIVQKFKSTPLKKKNG
jgi:hypothetical protein